MRHGASLLCILLANSVAFADDRQALLATELRSTGWIVFGARADNATWDLFVMRPDGSDKRNITNTAEFEEAAPRLSPGGNRLLYRRLAKGTKIDHDKWGFQGEPVVAMPDGSNPESLAAPGGYPWASWSPDGKAIICLTPKAIQIIDIASKQTIREMPRKGIYQQLFWSPDGKWLTGTGNHQGESWTVVRMNSESGDVNPVHIFQSCTPDWFPDSQRILYSSRPKGQKAKDGYGWTQLWSANGDGSDSKLVFGEDGFHIYGGALSPDARYVLFTKCPVDGGGSESAGAPICVMRLADAPIIQGESMDLRAVHPITNDGPVLELSAGWEPCWTLNNLDGKKS
ncbi:MAG: hypothetical protein SGI88_14785 [Candidatus Hydrogenedentes bacterium]|nr:hypothetical protein [Candidatus Hydrogenedentota bacterium]